MWLGVACPEVVGLAEPGGRGGGLAYGTAAQGSPAAGKGEKRPGEELDPESTVWCAGARAGPGWAPRCRHKARSAPTPTHVGKGTLPASLIILPGGADRKGMRSKMPAVAASQWLPITTPVFSGVQQHDGCFDPRSSSLRLGVGASISQPCSDSTLYFGNWQNPSVAPMVL